MRKLSALVHDFETLSFEQKCIVAKKIAEHLENGSYYYMQNDDDTAKVVQFFNRLLNSVNNRRVVNGKTSILERFSELSQERKEKTLESIIKEIENSIKEEEQEKSKKSCEQEGHIFSGWHFYSWTERGIETDPRWLQEHPTGEYEIEHEEWRRTCTRCGYVEVSGYEPEEARTKRLAREKNIRMQQLKRELRELEGK